MAGVYGTVRPANINVDNDVEIFYHFRPSRSTDDDNFSEGFKKGDASWLVEATREVDSKTVDNLLLGVYNLRLPLDIFSKRGFYSVYIRPKEIFTTIADVNVLASYPDTKGVVFDLNDLTDNGQTLGGELGGDDLTGFRIDYLDDNGNRTNITRLITYSNRCQPVSVTTSDSYNKGMKYIITDTGSNLLFCTVTPSASNSFNPNVTPFIGSPGKKVILSNTKFNPILIEIEMVEHDADTLTYMIEGDQARNRDKAIITTYNEYGEIYKQQDYYTVKDSMGNALYDIKRNRENIDSAESYDNVIDNV